MSTPRDRYYIPVSNGLLEHRAKIGPAIWVFLWLIDHVTKELPAEGNPADLDGLVLGGSPIRAARIAADLRDNPRTVQAHLSRLFERRYIRRIPGEAGNAFGYIVLKSKKWTRKESRGLRTSNDSRHSHTGTQESSSPSAIDAQPRRNLRANKEDNTETVQILKQHMGMSEAVNCVCTALSLTGNPNRAAITEVIALQIEKSAQTAGQVASQMVEAWTAYDAILNKSFSYTDPIAFFAKGVWLRPESWVVIDKAKFVEMKRRAEAQVGSRELFVSSPPECYKCRAEIPEQRLNLPDLNASIHCSSECEAQSAKISEQNRSERSERGTGKSPDLLKTGSV